MMLSHRCWDIGTGECWNTWSEETVAAAPGRSPQDSSNKHWVWGVDLTTNYVFSASQDKTIKIWVRALTLARLNPSRHSAVEQSSLT
jgi:hypothetical protein